MNKKEILQDKARLANSVAYREIRTYQLDEIVNLAGREDSKVIEGMLKLIKKTDNWTAELTKALKAEEQEG